MLFSSIEFAVFLPVVFFLYWFVTRYNLKLQNLLLLISSYVFYGWWDWRFLFLLTFSALIDYYLGLALSKEENTGKRKLFLLISLSLNLVLLGFFKYYNFFITSFSEAFTFFGNPIEPYRLSIILPVGISFYTFQSMSYGIDIYKKQLEPTKDVIAFLAFVSFFPQLVAGPIERATNLLPQFYKKRVFDYSKAVDGARQILWGLFKKIVIADNCAAFVNNIFSNYQEYSGSTLLIGIFFFSFQIYCDFSGYSDIAIGTARLFGFELMRNFAFPYFSRDIAEFWRRWHISLSTWFRDYVYLPLGGSRGGMWMKVRNTFIIFLLSGFWHGANWTFLAWGFINACYFLPLLLLKSHRVNTNTVAEGRSLPNIREFFQIGITFFLTMMAWVFFRASSITEAIQYIKGIFTKTIFTFPQTNLSEYTMMVTFIFILLLLTIEWLQRDKQHGLELDGLKIPRALRWGIYYSFVIVIFVFSGSQQDFIYFAF